MGHMKLKQLKMIVLVLAPILSGGVGTSVYAGAPALYDSWSYSSGTISTACPAGFTCNPAITDEGMLQRTIFDSSGDQYIQQIIADYSTVAGNMTLETFVLASNSTNVPGIASKQHIVHNETDQHMEITTELNIGWANAGENAIQINQYKDTAAAGYTNVFYSDNFTYYEKRDTTTQEVSGKYTRLEQGQLGSTYYQSDGSVLTTGADQYSFVLAQAEGVFNTTPGSALLTNYWTTNIININGTTTGGTVAWNAGDNVRTFWWGQYCVSCGSVNTANMSLQILENVTTASSAAGVLNGSTDPLMWVDPLFGTIPTLIKY